MLHYNFPPYSVGEVGFLRSPGRREIGHGKLAWRAIMRPLICRAKEEFSLHHPDLVSEITESNGSSSMATVCGSFAGDDGCRRSRSPGRWPASPWA